MRKSIFILLILLLHVFNANAYVYEVAGGEIYYMDGDDKEVLAMFLDSLPNEDVFIRMSPDCQTFTIHNRITKEFYKRVAPTTWPGIKLRDCLNAPEPDIIYVAKNCGIKGGYTADPKRSPQFHYLCVFSNEYNDSQWNSFDDSEKVSADMKTALTNLSNKQNRRAGKQYIITPQNATKQNIINCLDTIYRHTKEDDLVFIYLSSHGEYDNDGIFHFIVKDSQYNKESKQIKNALSKDNINSYVNFLTGKNVSVLLFVDACNAGDLANNDNVGGRAAYYLSTRKKSNAFTDKNGSCFAQVLMDAMNGVQRNDSYLFSDGIVDVGALGLYLEFSVYKYSNHLQYPHCEPHDYELSDILWKNKFTESKETQKNKDVINDIENSTLSQRSSAMIALGDAYLSGKDINNESTIKSIDSALIWYSRAERLKGNTKIDRANACYGLYNCYREMKNAKKAIENLQIASEHNNKALYELGLCYIDAYGVQKDYNEAMKLIWKAAKGKNACHEAQWFVGFLYSQRAIVDKYLALFLFASPEQKKNFKADDIYTQALYYSEIFGVSLGAWIDEKGKKVYRITSTSNPYYEYLEYMKESFNWYQKSASNGNAQAKYDLGLLYYDGIYVDKNQDKGLELIQEAAQMNCKDAITFLKNLKTNDEKI